MLSFAPSAAAVWHSDRVKITYKKNSLRHSVFFKRWAGQFVSSIHEVEFKADASEASHLQMQKIKKTKDIKNLIEISKNDQNLTRNTSKIDSVSQSVSRSDIQRDRERIYNNL